MRPHKGGGYIKNLTNHLIDDHRYDDLYDLRMRSDWNTFLTHVALDLENNDVNDMNPATLGKILCSLEIGDVMVSKDELFQMLHFSGDCEGTLRELVALCLAYVIRDRLELPPTASNIPPYRRTYR